MEQQQEQSAFWERVRWLCWGATGTLCLTALAMELVMPHGAPRYETPIGWFLVWLLLQGLLILLGVVVLLAKGWKQINPPRANRAFSFWACAWLLWPALAIAFPNQDADIPYIIAITVGLGGILLALYIWIRRKSVAAPAL